MNQKIANENIRFAIPVTERNGLLSKVSRHFGKSVGFMLVDSNGGYAAYMNVAEVRREGECAPIQALQDNECQVILCYSMGRGAYTRCLNAGFEIYKITEGDRVIDVMNRYGRDVYERFGTESLCSHGHDSSC